MRSTALLAMTRQKTMQACMLCFTRRLRVTAGACRIPARAALRQRVRVPGVAVCGVVCAQPQHRHGRLPATFPLFNAVGGFFVRMQSIPAGCLCLCAPRFVWLAVREEGEEGEARPWTPTGTYSAHFGFCRRSVWGSHVHAIVCFAVVLVLLNCV